MADHRPSGSFVAIQRSIVVRSGLSRGFIAGYITTMRPYLMFISGITGIAAMAYVPQVGVTQGILISLASFLSYGFGQALTDCFQIDTDSISAPYRPLTKGTISRRATMITSLLGLALCVSIFGSYRVVNIMFGITACFGLFTYTFFKQRWWAGPLYNAWIVGILFVMAILSAGAAMSELGESRFLWAFLLVFFGYANFVLTGYFKDIEADRATGYNTLPVVYGRRMGVVISDIFAGIILSAAIGVLVSHGTVSWRESAGLFAFGAGIAMVLAGQFRLHRVSTDASAHEAIIPVVHSYMLLLSGVALLQRIEWLPGVMFYYGLFILILNHRPSQRQV